MVLKTFQVRELKHVLEENGHDPMPFINPYLETFYKYPGAFKLIMKQVEENENEQKDEQELQDKVQKAVKRYRSEMERTQIEVNRMSDENNKG